MSYNKKTFAMSMYASQKDLYEAKAKYFEEVAEEMEAKAVVAENALSNAVKKLREYEANYRSPNKPGLHTR